MKEKPILFSTPMVQAILDGRKTQTRRVIKYPKNYDLNLSIGWEVKPHKDSPELFSLWWDTHYTLPAFRCPYGQSGDVLWVRETWFDAGYYFIYKADCPIKWDGKHTTEADGFKWRPSIFMPREACRIRLEITDVRVERLQDISEDDAKAEGIEFDRELFGWLNYSKFILVDCFGGHNAPVRSYRSLWESINGKGSWEKNPWVWVVEFKRIDAGKS